MRGSKIKWRKGHYMKYFGHWIHRHQTTKQQAARRARRSEKALTRL